MQSQLFTAEEFKILKSWSGWATIDSNDHRNESDEVNNEDPDVESLSSTGSRSTEVKNGLIRPSGLSRQAMIEIGRRVKCIFDYGRVEYLKSVLGFRDVVYTQYCDKSLTCECRLICGRR